MSSNNVIYAWVGPCIGQKNYEVDLDFFKKFTNISSKNKKYFLTKNKKKKLFNLRKFVSDILRKYKVKVDQVNRDTFSEKSNFFSYRRATKFNEKDYGRCISSIVCINFINLKRYRNKV